MVIDPVRLRVLHRAAGLHRRDGCRHRHRGAHQHHTVPVTRSAHRRRLDLLGRRRIGGAHRGAPAHRRRTRLEVHQHLARYELRWARVHAGGLLCDRRADFSSHGGRGGAVGGAGRHECQHGGGGDGGTNETVHQLVTHTHALLRG